jgi:hypothetical protein
VRERFEELVELDSHLAQQRLTAIRRDDPELADELASLLAHHDAAGRFLAEPATLANDAGETLAPGMRLGAFEIEREAGRGGMGHVYVARDTRLLRRVCLKIVRPDLVSAPSARERLRREAQVAASILHPGICTVHALDEVDGTFMIVTEFIDGHTLREEIGRMRPPPDEVTKTFRDLAAAVAFLHARGITHGDIKPENIMRSTAGELKILDFGLARADPIRGGTTLTDLLAGTLAYMAPEQINGAPAAPRSDVFALGIVLYEWAAGVHPFAAATALATTARILEHAPTPLDQLRPDLPASVVAAIERSLRKSPDERLQSAAALLSAMSAAHTIQPTPQATAKWWWLHQIVVVGLYLAACVAGWTAKEWDRLPTTRWIFIAIGVMAAIGGIVRGHLLFTARAHVGRLAIERRRARSPLLLGDVIIAALVIACGATLSGTRPVAAVLMMALGVAIALAAVVIEPATAAAVFDDPRDG